MKLLLQHKIVVGYLLTMVIIGCMVAIVLYERNRVQDIEQESLALYQTQRNINTAHRYVTILATYGESAIAWDEDDCITYHDRHLRTDSLLVILKEQCKEFIYPTQMDSLRTLLESKEECLFRIMQTFQQQEKADSLLLNRLTAMAKANQPRTITRKKKGIAGFFGAKETVQIPSSTIPLNTLNKKLISLQEERQKAIDTYTDSLRMHNGKLNRKLRILITNLDERALAALQIKEERIKASYNRSVAIITGLIIFAILLLVISYLIIQRDMWEKAKHDKRMEAIVKDLQENIQENQRLIEARRHIIQTVTHELRTPLAAIVGNAELIEKDREAERLRHLSSIQQSAGRMSYLLNTLMNYFRLDSGKESVHALPIRLENIVETLEAEFVPQMGKKRLMFEVNNDADEVVMGDRNMILRIGSNLLSNALKFTKKGSVKLTAKYSKGKFILAVEDSGTGIGKEKLEQIFKPFERLGNAATQDGFGLGLAIVKSLVDLMDGTITVESVLEMGSRFTVTLPLVKADQLESKASYYTASHHLSGCSVLSIDNDRMLLDMLHDMFEQSGIHSEICMDINQLMERLRGNCYDLLTTDLKMSDISGYEVLELLRSSDIGNSRAIPVMAITGSGSITEEELKQIGFSSVLFKPFSREELLTAMERCIGEHKTSFIDLPPLYAYGSKRERLECLISETEKEMTGIKEAVDDGDNEKADSWIHHIRSSWILIRAEQPLQELYGVLHGGKAKEDIQASAGKVLEQGEKIIRLAKKEIEKMIWEK